MEENTREWAARARREFQAKVSHTKNVRIPIRLWNDIVEVAAVTKRTPQEWIAEELYLAMLPTRTELWEERAKRGTKG